MIQVFMVKSRYKASAIRKITEIIFNKCYSNVLDVQIFGKDFLVDCPIDLEQVNDTLSIKIPLIVGNGIEFELSMSGSEQLAFYPKKPGKLFNFSKLFGNSYSSTFFSWENNLEALRNIFQKNDQIPSCLKK